MNSHPSALFWARYLANELSFLERWRFQRHCSRCSRCAQALAREQTERQVFDAAPARKLDLAVLQRRFAKGVDAPETMRVSKWAWAFAVPSFAAAMVLWVMAPRPDTQTAKGADFFTVVTKRGDDVKSLGATCAPKDQVRARFRSSQRYLLIVGVDATGDVQVLYPMGGISSQTLSDTEGLSPGSWELDEKPGTQRFIAFFSEKPLAVSDVTRVIRAKGASTPLLPKVNVVEQRCEKSAP